MNQIIKLSFKHLKFDPYLLGGCIFLMLCGIVMVTSASIAVTEKYKVTAFYFMLHHLIYLLLGVSIAVVFTFIPIKYLEKISFYAGFLGIVLLGLVFIPGLSRIVNGSYRWIFLGKISFQPSELAKLLLSIYISGYLVRKRAEVRTNFSGFAIPLIMLLGFDGLLILEPDFGTMLIVSCMVFSLLFIAGVKLRYLLCFFILASLIVTGLLFSSTYRLQRIVGFLNPWQDQFAKGYQLVQALIALGRGGWFGLGLGNSVQKLLYLPEAYTDFIFAIIAEELGLVGGISIIIVLTVVVARCFKVSQHSFSAKKYFSGYLAYSIAMWLGLQSLVNIGVNIGLLPTKGLTLPFISYGGNSLLACCIAMGIIFRIDFEIRSSKLGNSCS